MELTEYSFTAIFTNPIFKILQINYLHFLQPIILVPEAKTASRYTDHAAGWKSEESRYKTRQA
jgi:hypothetical protein